MQRLSRKDLALGAVFIAFALVYGITALMELPMGTPFNMGPGFFPIMLSGLLLVIGIFVALRGLVVELGPETFGPVAWRGLFAISASTIVFAATAYGAGLVVAVVLTVLVASLASRRSTVFGAVGTALVLAVLCTVIFVYGLRVPLGLVGAWFR